MESVALPSITNYIVECKDSSKHDFYKDFHEELVVPDLNPEVYKYVEEFLKNG